MHSVGVMWYTLSSQLHIVCSKDLARCLKIPNESLPDVWHQQVPDKDGYRDMNDAERRTVAIQLWEDAAIDQALDHKSGE